MSETLTAERIDGNVEDSLVAEFDDNHETLEKTVQFIDSRGIERRPHEEAVECYASAEIQKSVSKHFELVNSVVSSVQEELEDIDELDRQPIFDPLSNDLLEAVIDKSLNQLPSLPPKHQRVTAKLREELPILTEKVDKPDAEDSADQDKPRPRPRRTVSVEPLHWQSKLKEELESQRQNQTPDISMENSPTIRSRWERFSRGAKERGSFLDIDRANELEEKAAKTIELILTGNIADSTGSDMLGDRYIPILAKSFRDSELSEEQLRSLGWKEIVDMAPEIAPFIDDIGNIQEAFELKQKLQELKDINLVLSKISPSGCRSIARIYYDNETILEIAKLDVDVAKRMNAVRHKLGQESNIVKVRTVEEYQSKEVKAIGDFFKAPEYADTLYIHGSPYAPRIIRSKSLKAPTSMSQDEYTPNTHHPTAKLDGARGVHWATAESGRAYAPGRYTKTDLEARLLGRSSDQDPKGGVGEAIFGMRLGDIIRHTPFTGGMLSPYESDVERLIEDGIAEERLGLVEFTDAGWEKVHDRVEAKKHDDSAFAAESFASSIEGAHNYSYPINEMVIGVSPSLDQEATFKALKSAGWSDEEIAARTFTYNQANNETQLHEIQQQLIEKPKYPKTVVSIIA